MCSSTREGSKAINDDGRNEALRAEQVYDLGIIAQHLRRLNENVTCSTERRKDVEDENLRLKSLLGIARTAYSLTEIRPDFSQCVDYDMKSARAHLHQRQFSPLSRGRQGAAVALTALAATCLLSTESWNQDTIDRIVQDGDAHYRESYQIAECADRETFSLRDLKRELIALGHSLRVIIHDPRHVGTFRSTTSTEMHLAKALQLHFDETDVCLLESPVLNLAIWREGPKLYHVFDGRARGKDGNVVVAAAEEDEDHLSAAATLFATNDLAKVTFLVQELSNVANEPFVLYDVAFAGIKPVSPGDEETCGSIVEALRASPSGYQIRSDFRALVRGSYHLAHPVVPQALRNGGHLVLGLVALVYSKLTSAKKWSTAVVDVIFNQAHLYLMDLSRVLGKSSADSLAIKDLLADVIVGCNKAKVKVTEVVPGQQQQQQKKKGKTTLDANIRDFFRSNDAGLLEIKKTFYAVWKQDGKYYFLDPFACDRDGFRVDPHDAGKAARYKEAKSCVSMNSSVNELAQVVLENTDSTEKDVSLLHKVRVLYVKSGPTDRVVYRDKNTKRRPNGPEKTGSVAADCRDILRKAVAGQDESQSYRISKPHVVELKGTKSLARDDAEDDEFRGVLAALTCLAKTNFKDPSLWTASDMDDILDSSGEESTNVDNVEKRVQLETEIGRKFPEKLTFGGRTINFKTDVNVGEASVDSQVQLIQFNLILESAKKARGLWKRENKYFFFDPYISSLVVTDSATRLVDILKTSIHDEALKIHTVEMTSIQSHGNDDQVMEPNKQDSSGFSSNPLHLLLLASTIVDDSEENEISTNCPYEKMKHNLPRSYALPQENVFCTLLTAKSANKSDCSLLSRFSVDSRLEGKGRLETREVPQSQEMHPNDGKDVDNEEESAEDDDENWKIAPTLIPLGPVIRTSLGKNLIHSRAETETHFESSFENLHDKDVIFNLLFAAEDYKQDKDDPSIGDEDTKAIDNEEAGEQRLIHENEPAAPEEKQPNPVLEAVDEPDDVQELIQDGNVAILRGTIALEDRKSSEEDYLKACFYSAISCILGKTVLNPRRDFQKNAMDQLILNGKKMQEKAGRLRFNAYRRFFNIEIFDTKFDVLAKLEIPTDPDESVVKSLKDSLDMYLQKHSSGILLFGHVSYAFWHSGDYFLFDPYGCDENGNADDRGTCCVTIHKHEDSLLARIMQNTANASTKPHKIFSLAITHMESLESRSKSASIISSGSKQDVQTLSSKTDSEGSLIELRDWVKNEDNGTDKVSDHDKFCEISHGKALALEAPVLEQDATGPGLALLMEKTQDLNLGKLIKKQLKNKQFEHEALGCVPLDVCLMSWSYIYEPSFWTTRTVKGLFKNCQHFVFRNVNFVQNMSLSKTDVLPEISMANYLFRVAFGPLIRGTLYDDTEGWNLARCLKKIFSIPIYSGVIVSSSKTHLSAMTRNSHFYAWWPVIGTRNLRIVVTKNLRDLLEVIIGAIGNKSSAKFRARPVVVSYSKKMGPDGADTEGLHEILTTPATCDTRDVTLQQLLQLRHHRKQVDIVLGTKFVPDGRVTQDSTAGECYFVSLVAVVLKNDIVQCPSPEIIDNVVQMGRNAFREFDQVEFRTDLILKNVPIRGQLFNVRDQVDAVVATPSKKLSCILKRTLETYFRRSTCGVLRVGNRCYGFWCSRCADRYYYLNAHQCDARGRNACLAIFPDLCSMTKNIISKLPNDSRELFLHCLHVESTNSTRDTTDSMENPMWIHLDFHWRHPLQSGTLKKRKNDDPNNEPELLHCEKSNWNNYIEDIPDCIYSLWGGVGCYDDMFECSAGRNRMAICVTCLALADFVHPKCWSRDLLDFAAVQGNAYYNRDHRELKICGTILSVKFREKVRGVLYEKGQSLADTLERVFCEGSVCRVILECGQLCFAILAKDAFYIIDCCWLGPPLFARGHSGTYVVRCANMEALIYVALKILNTDRGLTFHLTPVTFTARNVPAYEESKKELAALAENAGQRGKSAGKVKVGAKSPMVPGSASVSNASTLICYRENVGLGLACVDGTNNSEIPSISREFDCCHFDAESSRVDDYERVSQRKPFDMEKLEKMVKRCALGGKKEKENVGECFVDAFPRSRVDLGAKYPQITDFVEKAARALGHVHVDNLAIHVAKETTSARTTTGILTRRGIAAFLMFNEQLKRDKLERSGKEKGEKVATNVNDDNDDEAGDERGKNVG